MLLTASVSRMSPVFGVAILIILVSCGYAKPIRTILGSGINIFDFLAQHETRLAGKFGEKLLSQLRPKKLFVEPVESKWERSPQMEKDKFQVILCDTVKELHQAAAGGSRITGLDSSFLKKEDDIGIPSKYLVHGYSYILVKYTRIVHASKLRGASSLSNEAEDAVKSIEDVSDPDSVLAFFNKLGTHYLSSVTVGDSVFQVYVFRRERYARLRWKLNRLETMNESKLEKLLSPFHFEYVGHLKTSSGSTSVIEWSNSVFYSPYLLQRYVEIRKDREHLRRFKTELERSETVLFFDLKSMEHIIVDEKKKLRFHEVLSNQLKLYEANL